MIAHVASSFEVAISHVRHLGELGTLYCSINQDRIVIAKSGINKETHGRAFLTPAARPVKEIGIDAPSDLRTRRIIVVSQYDGSLA
jgi:hypothetical protein